MLTLWMASVIIGGKEWPCHRTARGAIVAQEPGGKRQRYISSLTPKERSANTHAFKERSKAPNKRWLNSVPQARTPKKTSRRQRDLRTVYDSITSSYRQATPEEEAFMDELDKKFAAREALTYEQVIAKDSDYWGKRWQDILADEKKLPDGLHFWPEVELYERHWTWWIDAHIRESDQYRDCADKRDALHRQVTKLERRIAELSAAPGQKAAPAPTVSESKEPRVEKKTPAVTTVKPKSAEEIAAEEKRRIAAEEKARQARALEQVRNLSDTGQVRVVVRVRPMPEGAKPGHLSTILSYLPNLRELVFNDADYPGPGRADEEFYRQNLFPEQIAQLVKRHQEMIVMMYGASGSGKTHTTEMLLRRMVADLLKHDEVERLDICYIDVYGSNVYNLLDRADEHKIELKDVPAVPYHRLTPEDKKRIDAVRATLVPTKNKRAVESARLWISPEHSACVTLGATRDVATVERALQENDAYARRLRVVTPTRANPAGSSRSHLFIRIRVVFAGGKGSNSIYLLDLAGAEDYSDLTLKDYVKDTYPERKPFTITEQDIKEYNQLRNESKLINTTLSHIGNIIRNAATTPTTAAVTSRYTIRQPFERLLEEIIVRSAMLTVIATLRPDAGPEITVGGHTVGKYDHESEKTLLFVEPLTKLRL